MENARHHLLLENDNKNSSSNNKSLEHWGLPDSEKLMAALSRMGISGNIEHGTSDTKSQTACIIHIQDPYKASIEIGTTGTIITTANENVASSIYKIIDNILKAV